MGRSKKNRNNNNNNQYKRDNNNNVEKQQIFDGPLPVFNWSSINESDDTFTNEIQEKIDFWTNTLTECVGDDYKNQIYLQFKKTIEQIPALHQEDQINGLYEFYRKHPNVFLMQEKWPSSITKDKFKGVGFKVCSASGKRLWGGDDGVYRSNPLLQENLPRGCVMTVDATTQNNPLSIEIFGNRKFYGKSSGDDDESDLSSESIRRGCYSKFLVSNKANGESCHISVCSQDSSVWIIGSKNRKIAVRSIQDISFYKNETCYSMACEMGETFFKSLSNMGKEKENKLRELLEFTRWTLNFEFEYPAHQHIVPLTKAQLVLIGCSGIHVPCGKSSHPILGCSIARYFMFPTVLEDLKIYNKNQLDDICNEITKQWNTEGSVLILLDEDNNVIDFVKVKSWWYILLRCIREKIRHLKTIDNANNTCSAVIKRIQTLKNAMNIHSKYTNCFICFGTGFVEWLVLDHSRLENVIDLYPNLWLEYLEHNKLPIDEKLLDCDFSSDLSNDNSSKYDKYARKNLPLLILLQGIPGIGKSFLANKLSEKLNSENIKTKDIAQDDFVKDVGLKNSGKACLNYIRGTLVRREYSCIILARNNSNPQQYSNYVNLDNEGLCRAIFICPKELSTRLEEIVVMSVASVLHRQNKVNESHPTDDMDSFALASLPLKFFGTLRIHPSAFPLSIMTDDKINLPNSQSFHNLLNRFKSKGFRSPDLTENDLNTLGLNNKQNQSEFMKYRKDINIVTNDAFNFINHIISKDTPIPGSYFAILLHSDSSNRLLDFIKQFFKHNDIPKDWNISSDHVTLMHSNSYFTTPKNVLKWDKLQQPIGTFVTIKPLSLLVNDKLATITVSCETSQGNISLNEFVISELPHITIATAPGVSAFSSSTEIKNSNSLTDISNERDFTGTITFIDNYSR